MGFTTTYTAVTWTAGDVITEAKMDNMVANDQAYDSHSAQGLEIDEMSKPSDPSNAVRIYAKEDDGVSNLFALSDSSQEISLTAPQTRMRAYLSSNEAVVAATPETIIFDTEDYDIGSNYNNATGEFTVPTTGVYLANACTRFLINSDQDDCSISIYIDGGLAVGNRQSGSGNQRENRQVMMVKLLTAGEVLTAKANNGSNNDTIEGGSPYTFLEVVRLS